MIDKILVVQGAERNSVQGGLNNQLSIVPQVLALPIGSQCVTRYLYDWQKKTRFLLSAPFKNITNGIMWQSL
ncbi:MAG: hypothetical protein AB4080_25160 [Trichodesmium sp.]